VLSTTILNERNRKQKHRNAFADHRLSARAPAKTCAR